MPGAVKPYLAPTIPQIRLQNSSRINSLYRAGNIYLTVQDALSLAIENNLNLEISRYGPLLAESALDRARAGGPNRGVPAGSAQISSVNAGVGVSGSQASAGPERGRQRRRKFERQRRRHRTADWLRGAEFRRHASAHHAVFASDSTAGKHRSQPDLGPDFIATRLQQHRQPGRSDRWTSAIPRIPTDFSRECADRSSIHHPASSVRMDLIMRQPLPSWVRHLVEQPVDSNRQDRHGDRAGAIPGATAGPGRQCAQPLLQSGRRPGRSESARARDGHRTEVSV